MADMPGKSTLFSRLAARLFGGASGGVFQGMLTLALGSGAARAIGIVSIPVLTRLYTPEDFGVLAVFTALVAILAPLVTLRYVLALPLPRHDGLAMNLLVLSLGLMLVLSTLMGLVLWLWGPPLLALVSMDVLAPWWWLIALGVLGTASYEMLTLWATRRRAYRVIAQTSVTQSAAGALVKIGMGLAAFQPLGLLVGQVVAQAGGIVRLLRGFLGEFRVNWRYIRISLLRKTAWWHRGFPIWRVPSQFLMVFSMQAPMLFMAALYDAQTAGQFGLAVMALSVPVNLIGQSVGKALYGEAAFVIKNDPQKVIQLAKEVQGRLFFAALFPTLILFFFGEIIFFYVFGHDWAAAGVFAAWLSIGVAFQFTSAPLVQLMNLFSSQSVFLIINVLRFIGLILVFQFVRVNSLNSEVAVLIYSFFTAFFYLCVSILILIKLKNIR